MSKQISLRLKDEEYDRIQAAADLNDMSLQDYIRDAAQSLSESDFEDKEYLLRRKAARSEPNAPEERSPAQIIPVAVPILPHKTLPNAVYRDPYPFDPTVESIDRFIEAQSKVCPLYWTYPRTPADTDETYRSKLDGMTYFAKWLAYKNHHRQLSNPVAWDTPDKGSTASCGPAPDYEHYGDWKLTPLSIVLDQTRRRWRVYDRQIRDMQSRNALNGPPQAVEWLVEPRSQLKDRLPRDLLPAFHLRQLYSSDEHWLKRVCPLPDCGWWGLELVTFRALFSGKHQRGVFE